MTLVEKAYAIAEKAHKGQKRKLGESDKGKPYIVHPVRVAKSVKSFGPAYEMVAVLHDVVEDTPYTLKDLEREGFTSEVLDAVNAMTHKLGAEYLDYVLYLAENQIARVVKMADIRDNLRDLHKGSMRDKYYLALYILATWETEEADDAEE